MVIMEDTSKKTDDTTKKSTDTDFNADLSSLGILDTSKGDLIDDSKSSIGHVHAFKCMKCGFRYEGDLIDEKCPRCGSEDVKDV
jgi:rubrerythrin